MLGDLLAITATWWIVSLSGVLMPGPVSALAITEGARRGAAAGPLITAGHAVAELVLVVALGTGLSQILRLPAVVGGIGVVGGAVLLWMGWGIVRTARVAPDHLAARTAAPSAATPSASSGPVATSLAGSPPGRVVRTGLLITVSNPYWLLWWATVGAAYYLAFSRFGVVALVTFFLIGHLALDLGWNTFLALAVGAGRGRLPARAYQLILAACGVFVMAMSAYFVYSGVGFLTR
ncbi:MAG: LysE family transporter [Armatimonadota bacterium]|nr:LysE family transporter [Armatimonadota bacterium]